MSHLALYRKYRPKEFGEVLGQEHVVGALSGAVRSGAVSHAYLFSGTRGTGKTSIARIFAKAIGCSDVDLYEIDAASNRGIDDVRELRESVKTLPFESKYKVYIIDEAHMLTKEAFNALLKITEILESQYKLSITDGGIQELLAVQQDSGRDTARSRKARRRNNLLHRRSKRLVLALNDIARAFGNDITTRTES